MTHSEHETNRINPKPNPKLTRSNQSLVGFMAFVSYRLLCVNLFLEQAEQVVSSTGCIMGTDY